MSAISVRGACPRLFEPMPTGDGLLARMVVAGPVPLGVFAQVCALAREHGNGVMEVSARGSLQVRGLTPSSAPLFAAAVASLAVPLCESVPVIAAPLRGEPASLIDADAMAAALSRAIAGSRLALAPKVSAVIDDGGALHLDDLYADIRLRAVETADGPMIHLALAGDGATARPLGMIAVDNAAQIATGLLAATAALGPNARAGDLLCAEGIDGIRRTLGSQIAAAAPLPPRGPAEAIRLHALKDGYALGLGLAFGHAGADALIALAGLAGAHGAAWARPAPDRSLLLAPLTAAEATAVRQAAARLGFIVEADDPRRRIVACAGSPSCASGLIPARAIAAELAPRLSPALPLVHISGCAKACAHPAPAPVTIVGTPQGCAIVRDGAARETPEAIVAANGLAAALAAPAIPQEGVNV